MPFGATVNSTTGTGILLVSIAYFLFTAHDGVIKLLVDTLPVWQILFFRSLTILAISFAIGRGDLVHRLTHSPIVKPMAVRSLFLLSAWLSFYTAAASLPLAELTTLYFAAPVVATVLAVIVLKEEVSVARWSAVAVGFAGVVIASDPSGLTLSVPVYLALLAACLWAAGTILLRKTAMAEKSIVQMAMTNLFFLGMTGVALFFVWRTPSPYELLLIVSMGVLGGAGQFAFFEAMRRAPVSVLAPFEYTSLVWAFLLGYLVWGDIPKLNVSFGAALIVLAGVIILVRERLGRRARA